MIFRKFRGTNLRMSSSLYPTWSLFSSKIIGRFNKFGYFSINESSSSSFNSSKSMSSFWYTFERVDIMSSVPFFVKERISISSSLFNGSLKMFLSLNGSSFSVNHARALRHDVQLGVVYSDIICSFFLSL